MKTLTFIFLPVVVCPMLGLGELSLFTRSPFISVENSEKGKIAPTTPKPDKGAEFFELRSVSRIDSKFMFSVHDSRTGRAVWIADDEVINGFRITSYNPKTNIAEFLWNGKEGSLKLNVPSGIPIAVKISPTVNEQKTENGRRGIPPTEPGAIKFEAKQTTRGIRAIQRSQNSQAYTPSLPAIQFADSDLSIAQVSSNQPAERIYPVKNPRNIAAVKKLLEGK